MAGSVMAPPPPGLPLRLHPSAGCRPGPVGPYRLFDLFPKATAIRNIWKHELSLVESERFRVFVFTERQRESFPFHAPATANWFTSAFGGYYPILCGPISIKDQVFVFWTSENDGRFSPVTN